MQPHTGIQRCLDWARLTSPLGKTDKGTYKQFIVPSV